MGRDWRLSRRWAVKHRALQGGDQVGQVTVTWIPVEHESGSVLDDQMINHG